MPTVTKFVIQKVSHGLYCKSDKLDWTAFLERIDPTALFKEYAEAQKVLDTLPKGFYQIDKIFRVI